MSVNKIKLEFKRDFGYFPQFSEPEPTLSEMLIKSFGSAFGDENVALEEYQKFVPAATEKEYKKALSDKIKKGFLLSKAMQADFLQVILDSMAEYKVEEKPVKEFSKNISKRLVEAGFLQNKSDNKKASRVNFIIDTALTHNYAKTRFEEMKTGPDEFRYRRCKQYERPTKRKAHIHYDGMIFDILDNAYIPPPWGANCFCDVTEIVFVDEFKKKELVNMKEFSNGLTEHEKSFNPLSKFEPDYSKYDKEIADKLKGYFDE